MRRKEETFSSSRATTPLAAIMKSSIRSVARFFVCFRHVDNLVVQHQRNDFTGVEIQRAVLVAQFLECLGDLILQLELSLQIRRRGHFWRSGVPCLPATLRPRCR